MKGIQLTDWEVKWIDEVIEKEIEIYGTGDGFLEEEELRRYLDNTEKLHKKIKILLEEWKMAKGKNILLKVLATLGISYAIYRLMQKVVEKLTEEEEESNVGKKSNKGSSPKKREWR